METLLVTKAMMMARLLATLLVTKAMTMARLVITPKPVMRQ